jgi:hypothetical protein
VYEFLFTPHARSNYLDDHLGQVGPNNINILFLHLFVEDIDSLLRQPLLA